MIWKPLIYLKKKIYELHSTISNGWNLFYPRNHSLYTYWILQTTNAKIFTSPQCSYSLERCSRNSVGLRSFLSNYQNNIISRYYCNVGCVLGRSHKHANPFKSFRNISMAFVDTPTDSIRFDVLGLCKSTLVNSTKDILYSQN